jgi:hypothetical protein
MNRPVLIGAVSIAAFALNAPAPAMHASGATHPANGRMTVRDCTPDEVRTLVLNFTRAFNAGKIARLDKLWAKDDHDGDAATPSFQWYSTGKPGARFGADADNRATLMRYFAARHRKGERLRLVWMSHGGNSYGYFEFAFQIYRAARDLARPGTFHGKGAAICSQKGAQLAVWSVGPRI